MSDGRTVNKFWVFLLGVKNDKLRRRPEKKYMPVKSRHNLAETDMGIILQSRMVRRIFRQYPAGMRCLWEISIKSTLRQTTQRPLRIISKETTFLRSP